MLISNSLKPEYFSKRSMHNQIPKRRQGRPSKGAPVVGRESLIAAARKLLKKKMPAQITVAEVAQAAGVDPALVRYYFSDKSALFVAAAVQALAELQERQRRSAADGKSASELLRRRITSLLEILLSDPALHHLIVDRILHSQSKEARALRRKAVRQTCESFAAIIERGVASGEFIPIDARHLYFSIVGACSFPMAERDLFAEVMGSGRMRDHVADYAAFLADLFVSGLKPK